MIKKNLLVGLFALTMQMTFAQSNTFSELPQQVKNFVEKHFPTATITAVIKENDFLEKNQYDIHLSDGTEIEFEGEQWKEISTRQKAVPNSLIDSNIANYITAHYPTAFIKEIKKKKRGGYEVELSNGLDLEFNHKGTFLRIDK